ncbi:MAG TPA: F0F1 ATP synthase subunit A [Candidatus Binatia bacterium]|nr:F0F1 ATP synthase subunit A [Candidatus Binatia bacterium]
MMSVFSIVTAPLAPERLFNVGPLPVTNSMLTGVLTAIFVVTFFLIAARASQTWPKSKFAYWVEGLVELILGIVTESFGDRQKAKRFFPLLLTLFIFILASNFSGLLPGVETITLHTGGENVPLFRSFTTDLNSTLALAVLSLTIVQIYAFQELGFGGRFHYYFTKKWWKPGNIFIGLNEIFSELLRLVTLSLRLFGVIYGGEALLSAILQLAGNFGWAASVPIMFLEIFFSLVQAYLFMILTSTYLVMGATSHEEEHNNHAAPAAAES